MKTVTINLYSFSELSKEAKEKVILEHARFLIEVAETEEEATFDDDYVVDNIQANDYLFYNDGELAHCTTYTGKHPKAGITEFHFHGNDFTIN